ncbi:nuclear transport factor 2 family protein [Sphingomonas sp. RG327]|uniref:Nuclear transport factor 2 family protein n=1 Tax=Sphingomonas anseongensis TaxID=2908207 RepID=A0ABT0RG29_9SPHN|nr:nuclear transport factor 2 family protein [Sphingomonas anseongensis]MCL6679229.1 nuclear transport factor 2 family protein [Sphingomonas anseongensis]
MKLLLALLAFLAVGSTVHATPTSDRAAILRTISRMESAWNRGDFKGYMAGFKNPDVVFVSGGKFQQSWQGTLDHYIRDYGGSAERRGTLHFYNIKVDLLSPDAAMLVGQYRLVRGKRVTEGVNTRLFKKFHGRWLITMNHVSAYDVEPSSSAPEAR